MPPTPAKPPASELPPPASYWPFLHGRYDVKPGLTGLRDPDGDREREYGRGSNHERESSAERDAGRGRDAQHDRDSAARAQTRGAANPLDARVFQFDASYPSICRAKALSRVAGRVMYVDDACDARLLTAAVARIHRQAHRDAPQGLIGLTGRTTRSGATGSPGLESSQVVAAAEFDALAMRLPDDLAVVRLTPEGDRLVALHLCFPNHWSPAEKLGRPFATIHAPVAGAAGIIRRSREIVAAMVRARRPLVRFAWGIQFDDQLRHDPAEDLRRFSTNAGRISKASAAPDPRRGHDAADQAFPKPVVGPGREDASPHLHPHPHPLPLPLAVPLRELASELPPPPPQSPFDPERPAAWLRVERQCILGLPEHDAAVFTIRTFLHDLRTLRCDASIANPLAAAIGSMSPEARRYKNLGTSADAIAIWLSRAGHS